MTNNARAQQAQQQIKAPRVIQIKDSDIALIQKLMDGAYLHPPMIADIVSDYNMALHRRMREQVDAVWSMIHALYPQTNEGTWAFNDVLYQVRRYDTEKDEPFEGEEPVTISQEHRLILKSVIDGVFLTEEKISSLTASHHAGLVRIQEEKTRAVWTTIRKLYPETQESHWTIDVPKMAIVEIVEQDVNAKTS